MNSSNNFSSFFAHYQPLTFKASSYRNKLHVTRTFGRLACGDRVEFCNQFQYKDCSNKEEHLPKKQTDWVLRTIQFRVRLLPKKREVLTRNKKLGANKKRHTHNKLVCCAHQNFPSNLQLSAIAYNAHLPSDLEMSEWRERKAKKGKGSEKRQPQISSSLVVWRPRLLPKGH